MTRSRLVILAVVLVTLAILVRARSEDDTPSPTAAQAPTSSLHARTRAPVIAGADASIAGTIRDDRGHGLAAQLCVQSIDAVDAMACTSSDAHGAYKLDAVTPGQLEIWASARGRIPASYEPRITIGAGEHRDHIDLALTAGGVEVHGTITAAAGGKPIAGARVRVSGLEMRTDDTGRYSAWTRPSWTVVEVAADGYATAFHQGPAPGQLDVALSPGSRMSGVVVDDAGEPVAGAVVMTNHLDPVRDGSAYVMPSVLSDEHGHFTITGMYSGRYEVTARAAHGYGIAAATPLGAGKQVDGVVVRLAPGFELVGHVTTPDGATCVDSNVWLEDYRGHSIWSTRDGDGTLHVGGLPPGTYAVNPICADHRRRPEPIRVVIADRDVETSWPVDAGATIRGRIVTSSGRPVMGVDVYANGHGSNAREPQERGGTTTNADGSYALHALAAGHYELIARAWPSSTSPIEMKATLDLRADETATHDFEVDEQGVGSLEGHVVDTEGHAPAHLNVVLQADGQSRSSSASSDDSGNFTADGLPAATYTVSIYGDEGELTIVGAQTVEVRSREAATANLVVKLATGSIRGRVVDELGEPAAGVFVAATAAGGTPSRHFESSSQVTTDAEGRFVITHLAANEYDVRAFRREGNDTAVHGVAVGSDIVVHLQVTGSIAGVVHRASGRLGDLDVEIFDRIDSTVVRGQTFPNSDGHFEIADLPPGDYNIDVTADGSQGEAEATVVAGERANVDLAILDRVTVIGRVIEVRSGRPVPGMSMSANRVDSSACNLTTVDDTTRITDDDGRFTLVGVPRGMVTISGSMVQDSNVGELDIRRDTTTGGDIVDIGVIQAVATRYNMAADCVCRVSVDTDKQAAVVVAVFTDGAAERAGLAEGDVITAVDGIDTTGERAGLATMLLGGDVGTSVEVMLDSGVEVTLERTP